MANEILDCGHVPTAQASNSCGTGRAVASDGRTICYACADKEQKETLKTATSFGAYVSSDEKRVTTWTGGILGTIVSASDCQIFQTQGRAYSIVDIHGARWFARGLGCGMCLHMRRCK